MSNFNFKDTNNHSFTFWGKDGVDALERVDVVEAANDLYKLVCNYDKAFSTRLFRNIEKGSVGAEVLKNQIASLVNISWKTILTNKTLAEVKAENPNIESEVNAVLDGIKSADYDDFYVFFTFLNTCSEPTKYIFTKELHTPSLIEFEDGFSTVIYYLKEWLGFEEDDDIFENENARVESLDADFESADKDFDKAFSSDYEEGDGYPTYADGYREMYYDHFRR